MSLFDFIETMFIAGPPDEEPRTAKVWGNWLLWVAVAMIAGWGAQALFEWIWP